MHIIRCTNLDCWAFLVQSFRKIHFHCGWTAALSASDGARRFPQLLVPHAPSTFLKFYIFGCWPYSKCSHFRRLLFSMRRLLWNVRTTLWTFKPCDTVGTPLTRPAERGRHLVCSRRFELQFNLELLNTQNAPTFFCCTHDIGNLPQTPKIYLDYLYYNVHKGHYKHLGTLFIRLYIVMWRSAHVNLPSFNIWLE